MEGFIGTLHFGIAGETCIRIASAEKPCYLVWILCFDLLLRDLLEMLRTQPVENQLTVEIQLLDNQILGTICDLMPLQVSPLFLLYSFTFKLSYIAILISHK